MLECVGTLANLTIADLDYELLLNEFKLVPWIKQVLQPGIMRSHHLVREVTLVIMDTLIVVFTFFHKCNLLLQMWLGLCACLQGGPN